MRFWQTYNINEHEYGEQHILFVVSDNYNELFVPGADNYETDIFTLSSIKQDLKLEDDSYAIDELKFEINQLSCDNENDLKALYFILDSTDISVNRFCAVFFDNNPNANECIFKGKIESSFDAEDIIWDDVIYNQRIDPKRSYKFSAYSFDVSILENVKLWTNGKGIEKEDGTFIDDLYTRACGPFYGDGTLSYALLQPYFDNRICGVLHSDIPQNLYHVQLGNLYNILTYFLSHAKDILSELYNVQFQITLQEYSTGLYTNPMNYIFGANLHYGLQEFSSANEQLIELKLSSQDYGPGWSSVFINRKLVAPEISYCKSPENNYKLQQFMNAQIADEAQYSFKNIDNIAQLLFEIARTFGALLFINVDEQNNINIQFKQKSSIVDTDNLYIIGAKEAKLRSEVKSENDITNKFIGFSSSYTTDSIGEYICMENAQSIEARPTNKFIAAKDFIANPKNQNLTIKIPILTTSPLRLQAITEQYSSSYFPVNMSGLANTSWCDSLFGYGMSENYYQYFHDARIFREFLHNGILIALPSWLQEDIDFLEQQPVWRFASKILIKRNMQNIAYDTLTDYLNDQFAYDRLYYNTEYEITLPFWNGFSKNSDGSNAKWSNLQLGSKITLTENVIRYISGQWQQNDINKDYVVVSIERSLDKPQTKIKLQNIEKFAYGYWDGEPGTIQQLVINADTPAYNSQVVKKFQVATGESISAGDAVMIDSNGYLLRSRNHSDFRHKTIGIAKETGAGGDIINVQTSGEVIFEGYDFQVGELVFVRLNDIGLNVSQNILDQPNASENMIIILGVAVSRDCIKLNIKEFTYESVPV